jgi:hypothetical protein
MSDMASSRSHDHRVPLTTLASDSGSIPEDDSSVEAVGSTSSRTRSSRNSGTDKRPLGNQTVFGQGAFPRNVVRPVPGHTKNISTDPRAGTIVLPELQLTNATTPTTYYKYRAQLTFESNQTKKE